MKTSWLGFAVFLVALAPAAASVEATWGLDVLGALARDKSNVVIPILECRLEGFIDEQTPALVISRDDLIRNKLAAGREQDLLDVKVLRAAEKATRKPPP